MVNKILAFLLALSMLVSVEVPVEHDWMFYGSGPVKLNVTVSSELPRASVRYSVKRDVDLMNPDAAPILEGSVKVRTKPGRKTAKTLNFGHLEPGFYQVTINENKPFNIGVNPEQIQSPADIPEDFDAFWSTTISELEEVPLSVKWTLIPEHSSIQRECYHVEIPSFGGATMGGIIFIPTAEGRYPGGMQET
ncbi:MAG: acetylxylan esterase, partial [Bacteroidales bacterium]|nr:acetylxylan esterase [Bacteroidales bacterium]